MTVSSSISQYDSSSSSALPKRHHLHFNQDYDNDRALSDIHEQQHPIPSPVTSKAHGIDSDTVPGPKGNMEQQQQQGYRRSDSPNLIDKPFGYSTTAASNTNDNDTDNNQRFRSTSPSANSYQWSRDHGAEMSNRYHSAGRSTHEHFDTRFRRDDQEGHAMDEDSNTKSEPNGDKCGSPRSTSQPGDDADLQGDMMSDDDQIDDDESEENDDNPGNKDEGTIAINQDGFQSVHFSAGGKPVKVRSMFVDKLFR
jgi:hypothetical protein